MFELLFFDLFAALSLISASVVIFSSQPIRSVLSLIFTFFLASLMWMILRAEFLSLSLIFVYIGAVMTLFVFMVMMLNVDYVDKVLQRKGLILSGVFMAIFLMAFFLFYLNLNLSSVTVNSPMYYGSANEIGNHLYTDYFAVFQIIGIILLTAIVGALFLVKRAVRAQKVQNVDSQLQADKKSRLSVVDLRSNDDTN